MHNKLYFLHTGNLIKPKLVNGMGIDFAEDKDFAINLLIMSGYATEDRREHLRGYSADVLYDLIYRYDSKKNQDVVYGD